MRPSSAHPILKAFAASAALLTSNAWTTPFRYNEAVSGDLPDPRIDCCTPDWDAQTTLTADIGFNQISGSFEFSSSVDGNPMNEISDIDPFNVIVPDGLTIHGARFFYEITDVENVSHLIYMFELAGYDFDGDFTEGGVDRVTLVSDHGFPTPVDASPIALFVSPTAQDQFPPDLLPFAPGTWRFYDQSSEIASMEGDVHFTMNYRLVLDVRRIPEPSSLVLFGVGLITLGLTRHRPRSSKSPGE
jgi:hypothetical protein